MTTKDELMKSVLDMLKSIERFPVKKPFIDNTRRNVVGFKEGKFIQAFVLGKARSFSESKLVEASKNRRFPELLNTLRKLMRMHDPHYKWTSIQINKNVKCSWHRDRNNIGESYCLGLGHFKGGGIDVKVDKKNVVNIDNHNKIIKYNGHLEHRTATKKGGDRYAIIWFRHT